jgi:hypothetical protein
MNFIFFKIDVNRLEVKKIIIKMVARLATENDVVFRNFKRVKEEALSITAIHVQWMAKIS